MKLLLCLATNCPLKASTLLSTNALDKVCHVLYSQQQQQQQQQLLLLLQQQQLLLLLHALLLLLLLLLQH